MDNTYQELGTALVELLQAATRAGLSVVLNGGHPVEVNLTWEFVGIPAPEGAICSRGPHPWTYGIHGDPVTPELLRAAAKQISDRLISDPETA